MIVVNFATKEYAAGQNRLADSLSDKRTLIFTDYKPGWKTHQQSPYHFKIHAIEEAFKYDEVVLWADASMYLVGDLSKIENIILSDGYFMEEAGHFVKDWCNQYARQYFKFKPEEHHFTMFSAGMLGLSKRSDIAMRFFAEWRRSANAGCFRGDWSNHRHDMTCASIIANRLGMKYQKGGSHLSYIGPGFPNPNPEAVFHLQGI